MTVGDGPSTVPAGWYPDPADASRLRRWDGQRWTQDVVTARQPATSTVAAPQPQPVPSPAAPTPQPSPRPTFQSPEPPPPPAQNPEPPSSPGSIPAWESLPGLTLPPDLSSIPGMRSDSVLPPPNYGEPQREILPPPGQPVQADPVAGQPVQSPAAPAQSAPQAPAQQLLPVQQSATRAAPAYGPPPSGAQYDAPPPPGVTVTPGLPRFGALPTNRLADDEGLGRPQFDAPATPAYNAAPPAPLPPPPSGNTALVPSTALVRSPPMVQSPAMDVAYRPATSTVGVWLIAALPLIQFAGVYVVFNVLAIALLPGLQWGVLAAPIIFSLLFAVLDHRALINKDFDRTPPVLLAVIPPLYLLVRCFTVGARSIGALLLWIVFQAAAAAGVYFLLPALLAAAIKAS